MEISTDAGGRGDIDSPIARARGTNYLHRLVQTRPLCSSEFRCVELQS